MRPALVLGLLTCFGASLFAASAEAQQAPSGGAKPGQLTLRRDGSILADAQAARARARAGDCAGALASFDAALRATDDPVIHRDRGICHEKLGNPYPAIDDYRIYVTNRPDAPDTEQIRQRLTALEGQTGASTATATTGREDTAADGYGGQGFAEAKIAAGSPPPAEPKRSKGANIIGPKEGEDSQGYDYYVQQEKVRDAANDSPLRYGSGLVLGPFMQVPRFFVGDGASKKLAYAAGLTLRYSTGPVLTLVSELAFAGIGTSGETSAQSGPLLMGGVELRIPVARFATDHLLLRGGVGYERYVVTGSRAVTSDVLGRFAVGFRHVFGTSVGLELLADGGPVLAMPESGDSKVNGVIGLSVGFVVGF